jgi:hypothetical protein
MFNIPYNPSELTPIKNDIVNIDSQLASKANKDEIINGLTAKDGVKTWAQLQAMTTGNSVGDYYYCSDGDGTNPAGNYRWTGNKFGFGGTGDEGYNKVNNDLAQLQDIGQRKIDIDALKNGYDTSLITKFTQGQIGSDGILYPSSANFITTVDYISSDISSVVSDTNGTDIYRFAVFAYSLDGTKVGWKGSDLQKYTDFDHGNYKYKIHMYRGYASTAVDVSISEFIHFYGKAKTVALMSDIDNVVNTQMMLEQFDLLVDHSYTIGYANQNGNNSDAVDYVNYTIYVSELCGNNLHISPVIDSPTTGSLYFFDDTDAYISQSVLSYSVFTQNGDGTYSFDTSLIPNNAIKIILNLKRYGTRVITQYYNDIPINEYYLGAKLQTIFNDLESVAPNPWKGKKIVWIGTSISFGQYATTSYPYVASKLLGFNLINTSFPGISLDVSSDADTWSSALSIAEQTARGITIDSSPIAYTPGGSYNNYYRTYEHIFSAENADADLYVYSVLPNNVNWGTSDWDAFDKTNWKYTDDSSFESHRSTFLGALLFMMDKMYASNPNARMVFCVDLDGTSNISGLPCIKLVSDAFKIPIIDPWSKLQYNPKTKSLIKYTDGIHLNNYAHEHMGRIMAGELKLIS